MVVETVERVRGTFERGNLLGNTLREEDLKKVLGKVGARRNLHSRVSKIKSLINMPKEREKDFLDRQPRGRPRKHRAEGDWESY